MLSVRLLGNKFHSVVGVMLLSRVGSQVPTTLVAPSPKGFHEHEGEDAVFYARQHDYFPDEWQATTIKCWMRKGPDDRWVAPIWGITVPRQNGKNGALEPVLLYMIAVLGLRVLFTAQELKTAKKMFARMQDFFGEKRNDTAARFPSLNQRITKYVRINGQELIELDNGGAFEMVARSKMSGRGYTSDVLVIDEAQHLTDEELEALKPAISAAPSGYPITIYMGTPPKDFSEEGEPFVRVRNAAVSGSSGAVWVEFSAPGNVDDMSESELVKFVHNRANWFVSNPAAGIRIAEETIAGELVDLSPRSFARERMNMWPSAKHGARRAINKDWWDANKVASPDPDWPIASFGLDMNHERTKVTITPCLWVDGDRKYLEVAADTAFSEEGTTALVEWVWKRARRRHPVVIDAFSPARSLEAPLKKRGCKVYILGASEYSQACMGFHDAVKEGSVKHFDQTQLTASVTNAVKEPVGKDGAWKFGRPSVDVDLGPAISAACAWFGAVKFARKPRKNVEEVEVGHGFF